MRISIIATQDEELIDGCVCHLLDKLMFINITAFQCSLISNLHQQSEEMSHCMVDTSVKLTLNPSNLVITNTSEEHRLPMGSGINAMIFPSLIPLQVSIILFATL